MTKKLTPATDHDPYRCGEKNRNAKLTEEEVRAIRMSLRLGNTQQIISEVFRVSQPTISDINIGRTWGWLK